MSASDRPAHDWYRFVLSYPPHLVREYLDRFGLTEGCVVLDPFCGTGTTLVECKKGGIPSIGIEAHPMARFASAVKTDWAVDATALASHADGVAECASRILKDEGRLEEPTLLLEQRGRYNLRRLHADAHHLLLTNSISELPLHKTLVLADCIDRECHDGRLSGHERLALAKALVADIGNLEFGPEVGVGKPKQDAPVVASWHRNALTMADDIGALRVRADVPVTVHLADARRVREAVGRESIDAVITSPPYPNEKDYTRTTRLESVILGFVRNRHELRTTKRALLRSNTRNVYVDDRDDAMVADFPEVLDLARRIEERRVELGKTSGFERLYGRLTKLYFGGMARHLADLRECLRPGARLAYVVGDQASYLRVLIRTAPLLARIAESLGYHVESIDLFRTRLATATREQLREEVLVLRWLSGDGGRRV